MVQMRKDKQQDACQTDACWPPGPSSTTDRIPGFVSGVKVVVNGAPQKVTLTGRRDSTHRMNVRLTGKDWQPDAEKGRGIVLHTDRQSAIFSVELDGAQDLPWTAGPCNYVQWFCCPDGIYGVVLRKASNTGRHNTVGRE